MENLVHCGSDQHRNIYKTLDLLRLFDEFSDPVYFVLESSAVYDDPEFLQDVKHYSYYEGDCPVNYIKIAAIMTPDNDDPHGIFTFIRSVWMPPEYVINGDNTALIHSLFPEIKNGPHGFEN